ncbi:hypothetical protein HQQ81_10185 [Microbacteriaceae bacterium VKM Ac-2854]|nr:hypothetical protein [Microbacteriaceae bacterium VKM Ac-2854]
MVNRRLLAAALVVVALATAIAAPAATACVIAIQGTKACLGEGGATVATNAPGTDNNATPPQPTAYLDGQPLYDGALGLSGHCISQGIKRPGGPVDAVCVSFPLGDPGAPAVTLADIANFPPHPTGLTMQPAHWMLRDAPTNFVVSAGEHVVAATLLGQPAEVRYTPIGYSFDYGDGTTGHTDSGGATWADLGLDEFSETTTSHVYTKRGFYDVTASVDYTAEYRIGGGGWTPIPGTLPVPTTHTGRTVTIDTVLVRGTCDEYPEDPGCPEWDPGPLDD